MKAKWSHRADADLFEIGCYIATDNLFVLTVIEGHKKLPADLDLELDEPEP